MTCARAIGAGAASLVLWGCVAPGYYYDSSGAYSGSSYDSSGGSYSAPTSNGYGGEQSYIDERGNMVFREPGETTVVSPGGNVTVIERNYDETTVVRPDGGVTVIDRDSDGTRTIVDSDGGVKVLTPDGNCIGDC